MMTSRTLRCWAMMIAVLAMVPGITRAQPCRAAACARFFPADAGAINVRDYGAKGDGRTDDTAAITKAIWASGGDTGQQVWHDRLIFLPAGTYLVSNALVKRYADGRFASGMGLVGAGVERTIIRLVDHAPGFDDPGAPRGVIMTTSKKLDRANNRDYVHLGEGNDAYENFVESMTIDVGHGNPGAVGIDYLANNIGAIRDVLIRAPAGSGAIGLSLLRKLPGPALVQRVAVQGFDFGVSIAGSEYGLTFSQVELTGQTRVGFRNAGNSVAADHLSIEESSATALVNAQDTGLFVIAGGRLSGPAGKIVRNMGTIVFRDVRVAADSGARLGLKNGLANGWLQGGETWNAQTPSWNLPVPAAPLVDAGPPARWVGVSGEREGDPPTDVTAAVQAAANSGASTLYLRHGMFRLSSPIIVPPTLHRIIGMNSTVTMVPFRPTKFSSDMGFFRVTQPGPPLLIEHMAMDFTNRGAQTGVELAADRQTVLQDVLGAGTTTLNRRASGGEAYLEDIAGGAIVLSGPREVVARQLNTEGSGVRVVNHGAMLAVVGVKTEGDCTVVESDSGAKTEILGGLLYVVVPAPNPAVAAFVTKDASLSASFVEEVNLRERHYQNFLLDTQGAKRRVVASDEMPVRTLGHVVPLLWAGAPPRDE